MSKGANTARTTGDDKRLIRKWQKAREITKAKAIKRGVAQCRKYAFAVTE
jgi:hypothetical protein